MMMKLISSKRKYFIITLLSVTAFCCYFGHAYEDPAQVIAKTFLCFNNQFIYRGCGQAYRLNESGNINVPLEQTDEFCHGPCLAETQSLLNCIDKSLSKFSFYNRATVRNIRDTLHAGCSYTSQRGNFNVGDYIQGETSNSYWLGSPIGYNVLVLMALCYLLLFSLHM